MSSLDFVESLLSSSCRREALNSTLKSKLRGKKLLLERVATVALNAVVDTKPRSAKRQVSSSSSRRTHHNRAARRTMLLEAARGVPSEQLVQQHVAWLEYARTGLASAPGKDTSERASNLDWHGAQLSVVRSASESHACAKGVLLAETRRMLLLVDGERRAWVPKRGTVLELAMAGGDAVQCDAERRLGQVEAHSRKQPSLAREARSTLLHGA